jgi:hypothetical protein
MTVSEYKLTNGAVILEENIEILSSNRIVGGELIAGNLFIDALIENESGTEDLVYFMNTEIDEFEIVDDPEFDEFLPLAEQKFKIKFK